MISEMITQTQTVPDVLKGDWVGTFTMGPRDKSTLRRYCKMEKLGHLLTPSLLLSVNRQKEEK